jgi:hypothetical protein
MIKKLKHTSTTWNLASHAGGKEACNHGQTAISGEEDESGRIRDDVDLSPNEIVNVSSWKSSTPSIGGGTSYKRCSDKKVNF